ncbi:hypothetical protein ACIBLA_14535 [Streptomyces sp. NPDC050433]|uniref:hypothetical protein n=1 Tax=Streptomyces sp. NPDC050433 TaxID=3365615 RepID=UPI0037BA05CF
MERLRATAYTERSFAPELEEHPDLLALYQRSDLAELAGDLLRPATPAPVTRVQIQIRLPDGVQQPVNGRRRSALRARRHHRMADYFATDWVLGQPAQTPDDINAQDGTALTAEPGDVVVMHHLVPHRVGLNLSRTPRGDGVLPRQPRPAPRPRPPRSVGPVAGVPGARRARPPRNRVRGENTVDVLTPAQLPDAARLLAAGQMVAVPTPRWYMLCARAADPAATSAVFRAKQRPGIPSRRCSCSTPRPQLRPCST